MERRQRELLHLGGTVQLVLRQDQWSGPHRVRLRDDLSKGIVVLSVLQFQDSMQLFPILTYLSIIKFKVEETLQQTT